MSDQEICNKHHPFRPGHCDLPKDHDPTQMHHFVSDESTVTLLDELRAAFTGCVFNDFLTVEVEAIVAKHGYRLQRGHNDPGWTFDGRALTVRIYQPQTITVTFVDNL